MWKFYKLYKLHNMNSCRYQNYEQHLPYLLLFTHRRDRCPMKCWIRSSVRCRRILIESYPTSRFPVPRLIGRQCRYVQTIWRHQSTRTNRRRRLARKRWVLHSPDSSINLWCWNERFHGTSIDSPLRYTLLDWWNFT